MPAYLSRSERAIIVIVLTSGTLTLALWRYVYDHSSYTSTGAAVGFHTDTVDFGEIGPNEQAVCRFRFRNSGIVPVRVSEIVTSCRCTVAQHPNVACNPAEEQEVAVTFSSSGLTERTNVDKKVTVRFAPNSIADAMLTIRGVVRPYVSLTPDALSFDSSSPASRCRLTVKREAIDRGRFDQIRIDSNEGIYAIVRRDISNDEQEYTISIADSGVRSRLPPLELRIAGDKHADRSTEELLKLIPCQVRGPCIVPAGFVCNCVIDNPDEGSCANGLQQFQLTGSDDLKIKEIVVPDVLLSAIDVVTTADRSGFTVAPKKGLLNSVKGTALVRYSNEVGTRFGKLVLPVAIYVHTTVASPTRE